MSKELQTTADWTKLIETMSNWEINANKYALEIKPDVIVPVLSSESTEEEIISAIAKVSDIEKEIKRFKNIESEVKKERLNLTRSLTETSKRLMAPEKTYEKYYLDLEKALLPIKVVEDARKRKILARAEEVNNWKIACRTDFNNQVEAAELFIQNKITQIYNDALDSELSVAEVVDSCLDTFDESSFKAVFRVSEDEELMSITKDIYSQWSPKFFVGKFKLELGKAFYNFDEAKKDKIAAAEQRKALEAAAANESEQKKEVENTFVEIVTVVRKDELFQKTKELKFDHKLDMPNDFMTMKTLLKAFFPMVEYGHTYYAGKNYFDVIEPIIAIVEKMKNKGEVDFPTLKFKKTPSL